MKARMATILLGLVLLSAAVLLLLPGAGYRSAAAPLLVALGIGTAFILEVAVRERSAALDDAAMWYVGAVTIYTCAPLLAYLLLGLSYTPLNDSRLFTIRPDPSEVAAVGWLHVIFLGVFGATYLLLRGRSGPDAGEPLRFAPGTGSTVAVLWLMTSAVLLLPMLFFELRATTYLEHYTVVQQLPLAVRQLLKVVSGARSVLGILLLVLLFHDYRRRRWLIAGVLAWLFFETVSFGGSRTELMVAIAVAALLYHRFVRPVTLRLATIGGLALLLLFLALGVLRVLRGMGDGAPFSIAGGAGEFESVFGNAVDLQDRLGRHELDPGNLRLVLSDLWGPIPAQLLPFPKEDLSGWYLDTFYPHIAERGGGLAFGVVSQAIIGFGTPDLVLRAIITALVFALVHRLYRRRADRFWVLGFNAWFAAWAYTAFRVSTFFQLTALLQIFIPTLLLVEVVRRLGVGIARPRSADLPVPGEA